MIIAYLGGIGSGKSVSLTRELILNKGYTFVNYPLLLDNVERLKKEHLIIDKVVGETKTGKEKVEKAINWEFWKKQKEQRDGFNIALDEVHNFLHSRQATTKHNTLMTIWISQVRKLLGEQEDHHLYVISQKLARIDVALRDLLHKIVECRCYVEVKDGDTYRTVPKDRVNLSEQEFELRTIPTFVLDKKGKLTLKDLPVTWIMQYEFIGRFCVENYLYWLETGQKGYTRRKMVLANHFYRYYDSYGLVEFGSDVYV